MKDFRPIFRTRGASLTSVKILALQLRFSLDVSVSCGGLMSASPEGPGDDASGLDAPLRKLHRHTPDLLNRPADQSAARRALLFIFGGGIWFA
jgi:hypothetical protein